MSKVNISEFTWFVPKSKDKKTCRFYLRVTPEKMATVKSLARAKGQNISQFLDELVDQAIEKSK